MNLLMMDLEINMTTFGDDGGYKSWIGSERKSID
jgi:hypothetical protein